jgi:hypothetical protein
MDYERRVNLKLFVALLIFGSAIGSLWLGLTTSPEVVRISAWYIGALALAILGIIILKLPTTDEGTHG